MVAALRDQFMRASVAFWYEPLDDTHVSPPPHVELHFNLWRDLVEPGSNFFDVGILFKENSSERTIANGVESFFLFLPGHFQRHQCMDLSVLMEHGSTLNAVFNDVVTVSRRHERSFETSIAGSPHLTFHKIDLLNDLDLEVLEMDTSELGTTFVFKREFCERLNTAKNHYIRLRFKLDRHTHDLFTSDSKPSDWFLLSSFARTELTEFRWNERRSFPTSIANRARHYFTIKAVHYFLMRDVKFELVTAHTNFRKMRRLEEDLWKHYLRGVPPGADPGWRVERSLAQGIAQKMIIYHWPSTQRPTGNLEMAIRRQKKSRLMTSLPSRTFGFQFQTC